MRSSSLARFGVGLLVGSVHASPCKPQRSTTDIALTTTTTMTTTTATGAATSSSWAADVSSSTILFSVETPVSSTILEPDVTETETATTAADTATTLDVEYTTTTELTENSEATTSALPTTTTSEVTTSADTTTTTSEASWPLETFALVSSLTSGPLMGMPDPNWFTYFGPVNPGYAPLALTIEPGTNRLQAAEGLYVCTFWEQFESPGGVITCDIESSGVRYIECTQANNGDLSCRGEAVQCTDGLGGLSCSSNGDYVTQFLVQQQGLGYQLFLGYGSLDEYSSVTLKAVQPQTQ